MDKKLSKDGYIWIVENWDTPFKTWHNMGKDPEDERWKEEIEEKPKKNAKKKEVDD